MFQIFFFQRPTNNTLGKWFNFYKYSYFAFSDLTFCPVFCPVFVWVNIRSTQRQWEGLTESTVFWEMKTSHETSQLNWRLKNEEDRAEIFKTIIAIQRNKKNYKYFCSFYDPKNLFIQLKPQSHRIRAWTIAFCPRDFKLWIHKAIRLQMILTKHFLLNTDSHLYCSK